MNITQSEEPDESFLKGKPWYIAKLLELRWLDGVLQQRAVVQVGGDTYVMWITVPHVSNKYL